MVVLIIKLFNKYMKKRRRVQLSIFVLLIIVVTIFYTFYLRENAVSYDTQVGHVNIIKTAVQLYNQQTNQPLTTQEIEYILQGVVDEDTPNRWLNHFYDPVFNQGLKGKFLSSKKWAQDSTAQSNYVLGDYTWQRAIDSYQQGNIKEAMIGLGHILHLIADATVPAHTRNDAHILGDSYEQFVLKNRNILISLMEPEHLSVNNLDEVFDTVSIYSNNNFFSDDTIISKYHWPNINKIKLVENYYINQLDGEEYKVLRENSSILSDQLKIHSLDNKVLQDYTKELLPIAVSYSSGVIELFFKEVAKGEDYDLQPKKIGLLSWLDGLSGNVVNGIKYLLDKSRLISVDVARGGEVSSLIAKQNKKVLEQEQTNAESKEDLINNKPVYPLVVKTTTSTTKIAEDEDILLAKEDIKEKNAILEDLVIEQVSIKEVNKNNEEDIEIIIDNEVDEMNEVEEEVEVEQLEQQVTIVNQPSQSNNQVVYTGGGGSSSIEEENNDTVEALISLPLFLSAPTTELNSEYIYYSSSSQFLISGIASTSTEKIAVFFTSSSVSTSANVFLDDNIVPSSTVWSYNAQLEVGDNIYTFVAVAEDFTSSSVSLPIHIVFDSSIPVAVPTATSTTSSTINFDPSLEVVINEIAWAGTHNEYSTDEWIELFNNTTSSIDLSEWQIKINGEDIKISNYINTIIKPQDYYLLERSDDNTIKEIQADAIFLSTSGLKNSGAILELFDNTGKKIDEVDCLDGWFDGDTAKYRSMERIDSKVDGNSADNWQTNQGIRAVGRAFNGAPIYGSPKKSNFGFIALNYKQEDNLVILTKANNPYVLQYYEVPEGKTLQIESGVVIKSYYKDSLLDVSGKLDILGSSTSSVILTSGRDVLFDEDLLQVVIGGYVDENPQTYDWQGLWLRSGSQAFMNNIDMRFAGTKFRLRNDLPVDTSQAIRAEQAIIEITSSTFSNNGEQVIFVDNSTTTIMNTKFVHGNIAIKVDSGSLVLDNIELNNMSNDQGSIQLNNIWPNLNSIKFNSNTSKIINFGNVVLPDGLWVFDSKWDYLFSNLEIPPTTLLIVEPSTNIFLDDFGIVTVKGQMNAFGLVDEPITIGGSRVWAFIDFNDSYSILENVNIIGGGALVEVHDASIVLNQSDLICQNCKVWNWRAPGSGFKVISSTLDIVDSIIGMDNKWADPLWPGMSYSVGIRIYGGELIVENTDFIKVNYDFDPRRYEEELPTVSTINLSSKNYEDVYWKGLLR